MAEGQNGFQIERAQLYAKFSILISVELYRYWGLTERAARQDKKSEIALMNCQLPVILGCLFLAVAPSPGSAGEIADTREAIQRTEVEKDFVLEQMRLLLSSIVEVEDGLGSGDMDQVAREAAARGRKANANLPKPSTLSAKESDAWKAMFLSVRTGFDTIAERAKARAPASEINKVLADTMRNCVACHQTYRIVESH